MLEVEEDQGLSVLKCLSFDSISGISRCVFSGLYLYLRIVSICQILKCFVNKGTFSIFYY